MGESGAGPTATKATAMAGLVLMGLWSGPSPAQAEVGQPADRSPAAAEDAPAAPTLGAAAGRDAPQAATLDRISVKTLEGERQAVLLGEIWRVRPTFTSEEPPNASVLDYAAVRLFVADPLDELVAKVGARLPLVAFTAPNGQQVYMVASKITDVSRAIGASHHPQTKTIIGTRDGTQQVQQTQDRVNEILIDAYANVPVTNPP